MANQILIVNQNELTGKRKAEHDSYEYVKYEVTARDKFDQCYMAVYEIQPHKSAYPYHYHMANTEVFYILNGEGILDTPDGKKKIHAGDFIVFPPSEAGGHKLTNFSNKEPLRYIDFDTTHSPDVIRYPDSNKTGVILHNQASVFFQDKDSAEYYDGE